MIPIYILFSAGTAIIIGIIIYQIKSLIKTIRLSNHFGALLKDPSCSETQKMQLIKEMKKAFSDWTILVMADKYSWPTSILYRLPKLYFRISAMQNTVVVWNEITNLIPSNFKYSITATMCNGKIVKISMPTETAEWVDTIANRIEQVRLYNPYSSSNAISGIINQTMIELEYESKQKLDSDKANLIQHERIELLRSLDLNILAKQ